MDDIITTGFRSQHKTYARATISSNDDDYSFAQTNELLSQEDQLTKFFKEIFQVKVREDVSACHALPVKESVPDIVVSLSNRKIKSQNLRGTHIYINEHITTSTYKQNGHSLVFPVCSENVRY